MRPHTFLVLLLLTSACGRSKPISVTGTGAGGPVTSSSGTADATLVPVSSVPVRGTLDLKASSDTGQFSDDNITKINAHQFSGRIDSNVDFALYANDDKIYDGHSDGAGDFLISLSPLADGEYRMQVKWRAGDLVGTTIVRTCIDTVAPKNGNITMDTGSDAGRSASDGVTNVTNPIFQVVSNESVPAGDRPENHFVRYRIADSFSGGPAVLLIDSFSIDSGFVPPGSRGYKLLGPGLANGQHHITLRIEDLAGNVAE